jgi:hypothetical protein
MSFLERERDRLIELRDVFFNDPGSGLFFGKTRDFVLSEPARASCPVDNSENKTGSADSDFRGTVTAMIRQDICFRHRLHA